MKNEPKFKLLKMTLSSSRSNDNFSKHRYWREKRWGQPEGNLKFLAKLFKSPNSIDF